jgi:ectoine hydroxylase-related dioxygenase (phytanoyl-CoA dioxygenase family)
MDTVGLRVRDVTDEEIAHIQDKGWVLLRELISRDEALAMLDVAKAVLGEDASRERPVERSADPTGAYRNTMFVEYFGIADEQPLIGEFMHHPVLGRNVSRLMYKADWPIRRFQDFLAVKLPSSRADQLQGAFSGETPWHQDLESAPVRVNAATMQMSLCENTPDMGTIRFYEGSHKLCYIYAPDGPTSDPRLSNCPLSPPLHMHPGDVVIWDMFCLHGAGTNTSEHPRWALGAQYFAADAPYTGRPENMWPRVDELRASGLVEVGRPLDHELFPVIYQPDAADSDSQQRWSGIVARPQG